MAHYTNNFVYERIAPGVLDELRKKNPTASSTRRRKHKHHQWFTLDFGHPKLKERLAAVMALMHTAPTWSQFTRSLDRAFPRRKDTLPLPLL